jgi:hypothetical protein
MTAAPTVAETPTDTQSPGIPIVDNGFSARVLGRQPPRSEGAAVPHSLAQSPQLLDEGRIVPVPAETTARVVFGMFLGAAHLIVESDDPEEARREALDVITLFLEGMRR